MESEAKMKICHITSMHSWDDDRIYQRSCVGLADKGHEVYLIATETPSQEIEGVRFISLDNRSGVSRRLKSSREAFHAAMKLEADIYHFHDPDLLPWMYRLARKGYKVIYDVHENYAERLQNAGLPGFLKPMAVSAWRTFEKKCAKSFAGIITTTPSMQELFSSVPVPKLAVSNTPYLKTLSDTQLPEEKMEYTIYTSGSHSDKRNCLQTVEALPAILEKFPEARMIFAGRYDPEDYGEKLKQRGRELGVADHLEVKGMLAWKDNFKRTARMEVGCVFYEDNLNNRVTIPNRLFEYMYARVAVIGEYFPEIRRVVEDADCGILVNSSEPSQIAAGVIKMFEDQEKLKEKQHNGRQAVQERYAFDHELEDMINFYYEIIYDHS